MSPPGYKNTLYWTWCVKFTHIFIMAPIVVHNNQPPNRFYRGGAQISTFRSSAPSGEYEPEDWVASTTCCHGHDTLGLTKLDSGALLVDEIQNNAERWLSPEHIK